MDRRSILKNAGIAGILAAGAAPAVHAAQAAATAAAVEELLPTGATPCKY